MGRKLVRIGRGARLLALAALALVVSTAAQAADTRVYFLRGWFGVFSTGMDAMAEELAGKGIRAEAISHLSARSTVAALVKERAAGARPAIVLVGHSQGANNIIEMARDLSSHNIPVDLLITLAPYLQDPVPLNVKHAMNFYQSPGWGAPLEVEAGFKGKLSNINLAGDDTVSHIGMDKNAKVQAEIVRAIEQVARAK